MEHQALDTLPFRLDEANLFFLPHLSYLSVQGEKALDFLQGQLTCDIRQVSSAMIRQGALCNLKGRILALMDVLFWQNEYGLVFPKALLNIVLKDLALVAQLSRIRLTPMTQYQCFGLYVPDPSHLPSLPFTLPETTYAFTSTHEFACYALDKHLFMLLCPQEKQTSSALPIPLHDEQAWHQLLLINHHLTLHLETSGQFLPHQLQLDQTSWVSFEKGCYKGQEIIARMHYRSTTQYTLHEFIMQSRDPIVPGMRLNEHESQIPIDEVVDAVRLDEESYFVTGLLKHKHGA